MKKTILVTGGAGFVGTQLCKTLRNMGNNVISLDNYFVGKKENHIEGVRYVEGHTKNINFLIMEKINIIYHLGEYSRVHASMEEPEIVWDMNILGTIEVLEFCRKQNCKLVYAASSTKLSISEANDGTMGKDLTPYTWAKATNSDLINNYGKWFGLDYAIVYFYNVYGEGERAWGNYGTVIATFKENFLNKHPHKVNSPGTQTRAFTHVQDTVDAIILVGEHGEGDGYNISSSEVFSILEIAEMFGGEMEMMPQTKMSRSSTNGDTSKISDLGWIQKRKLKVYIEEIKNN